MAETPPPLRFGPPPITLPALVVMALAVVAVGIGSDSSGRLAGAGAAVLLLLAAAWVALGPVLTADAGGVTVRGLWRRRRVPWTAIQAIGVDDRRRSRALEIETDETLLAVPATLLGRSTPTQVAVELRQRHREALRAGPGPTPRVDDVR